MASQGPTNPGTSSGSGGDWRGYNYGFTIPAASTVEGIEVQFPRLASHNGASNYVDDATVQLMKSQPTMVGDDKASGDKWPTSQASQVYGGASDLWGLSWTPEEINDAGFGARILYTIHDDGMTTVTPTVFPITITVYFSGGSQSASILIAMIGTP